MSSLLGRASFAAKAAAKPCRPPYVPAIVHTRRDMATVAPSHDTMPGFRFGVYPVVGGDQAKPVHKIRVPRFESLEAERAHRKLHQAAALRWLGLNGYNNEGAGERTCTL